MKKIQFEYRITILYLVIGGAWILFSDKLVNSFFDSAELISEIQTFKGWFYVLITGLFLFFFLRRHLNNLRKTKNELAKHKTKLEELVNEKTLELNAAIEELKSTNESLFTQSELTEKKNTELNTALQELHETQAQLLESEKMISLGILTAGIAHEINNPLNFILGGYTGVRNHLSQSSTEKLHPYFDAIQVGIDRITKIVTGLDQFSRNTNDLDETCNIHKIIENSITMVSHLLNDKIKTEKDYTSQRLIIPGNIGQLHQLIVNILINSAQAIAGEGTIKIKTNKDDKNVNIMISDTGSGISKENLSKIFTPFYTTKEPDVGTGLGLSISYNIVQQHNGQIQFQSEPGKGTEVSISLPDNSIKS